MSKKIALLASLIFIFFASDAFATVVNLGDYDLGPSNTLVVEGVTISGNQAATIMGVGLGNDRLGSPGYLDRISHYGAGPNGGSDGGGYTTRMEGLSLQVNGALNSFTISPYFSVPGGDDAQLLFEFVYLGASFKGSGGVDLRQEAWQVVDPAVSSYTYTLQGDVPVGSTYISHGNYLDEMAWFSEYLYLNGWQETDFQYGFSITSIDYTPVQSVPEPGTLLLVLSGLVGCAAFRRRVESRR